MWFRADIFDPKDQGVDMRMPRGREKAPGDLGFICEH